MTDTLVATFNGLTPQQINEEYKRRYRELQIVHGRDNLTFEETVQLGEWYKAQWLDDILVRKEEEARERKARELAEKNAVEYVPGKPVVTAYIVCRQCGIDFPRPTTRGRPPVKCPTCREK